MRSRKNIILFIVPLSSSDVAPLTILERGVHLRSEEVRKRVPLLGWIERHNLVDARIQLVARGKAQRVAHIDDSVAGTRLHELERCVGLVGRLHLEPPLLAKEQRQRANIRVLLVAAGVVLFALLAGYVAEHGERAVGFVPVAVVGLEAVFTSKTEGVAEAREHRLGDDVGAGGEVTHDLEVGVVVEDAGYVQFV